jgi:hypothetical protein
MAEQRDPEVELHGEPAAPAPPAPPAKPATLADAIAARLVANGLVAPGRCGEVARGLADGTLSAETWRVLAEVTLELDARERKR